MTPAQFIAGAAERTLPHLLWRKTSAAFLQIPVWDGRAFSCQVRGSVRWAEGPAISYLVGHGTLYLLCDLGFLICKRVWCPPRLFRISLCGKQQRNPHNTGLNKINISFSFQRSLQVSCPRSGWQLHCTIWDLVFFCLSALSS